MFITSLIISFLLAALFSSLLVYGFGRRSSGPFNGMLVMFLIIFLFTWALGSWMVPVEPLYSGVSWIGYLFVAILIMLLLGVLIPPREPRTRIFRRADVEENARKEQVATAIGVTFGFFFWIMLIALVVLAIVRMFNQAPVA